MRSELAQLRLLQEVYRGRGRLSALCGRLNTQEKQIWQDKYRLLVKLGMRNRLRELLFGTRFCKSLQQLRLSLRNNPPPATLSRNTDTPAKPGGGGVFLPVV